MEWDTLVRHNVPVVSVIGNNGIWALEKHPMEALYGYSVVAELRPGTRYDEVVRALGGHGELVSTPAELRPALERALAQRPARRRQRAHRPRCRLSTPIQPRLTGRSASGRYPARIVADRPNRSPSCRPRTVDLCQRPPALPSEPPEQPILAAARRQLPRRTRTAHWPRSPPRRSTTRKPPASTTSSYAKPPGCSTSTTSPNPTTSRSSWPSPGKPPNGQLGCGRSTFSCSARCACWPAT